MQAQNRSLSFLRLLFAFVVATLLSALALVRTDSFSCDRIQAPLLEEQDDCFQSFDWPHTFYYLGRGRQMYVFESEDSQYVLKFFDREKLQFPWYVCLPFGAIQRKKERIAEKMRIYPKSYKLAFQSMREETGLVIVHMGRTTRKYPVVQLVNRAAHRYVVDLNTVPFIVQKKGTSNFLFASDPQSAIDQFLAIHEKRIRCKIADLDTDIYHNYSWNKDRLLYIDPARFFYEDNLLSPERLSQEWYQTTLPVRDWLQQHASHELTAFDQKVALCIQRCSFVQQ